jgi:hypothetical protein
MSLTIAHVRIGHHAVEPFAGRIAEEFVRQGEVFFGSKAEAAHDGHDFAVSPFHSPADGLLLFRLEERDGADFGQVTTEQIIDCFAMLLDISVLGIRPRHQIKGLDDLNVKQLQLAASFLFVAGLAAVIGEGFAHFAAGQIALLAGDANQLGHLFLEGRRRLRGVD